MFKWYTRPVFSKNLRSKGTDEGKCTERQCMDALRETSDELQFCPALTARLVAYAGPQCFLHTDATSIHCRLHANELRLSNEDGSAERTVACKRAVGSAGGLVMSKDSWFQCSNPRCRKWRCVDPSVADLLRGVEFFQARSNRFGLASVAERCAYQICCCAAAM